MAYTIFDLLDETIRAFEAPSYAEKQSFKRDGVTTHYFRGKVSRLDGPAVVYDDDTEDEYWLDGRQISKEVHDEVRRKYEDEKKHVIVIDGERKVINGKMLRKIKALLE